MKPNVLIVEDEPALVAMLRYNLESEGYRVEDAADGEEGLLKIEESTPDIVVLDWMLPGLSGLEVCRRVRRRPVTRDLPIIMLTARGEEADRVRGLDTGADDYMSKPFSPRELMARIRALLRRTKPSSANETLTCGDVVMDLAAHKVWRDGRLVRLGPTEFRLLRHFLEHVGRVLSREHLLDAVWGRDIYVEERTVDVHIRRLRKALVADGEADPIRTVRSAGYALEPSEN